MGKQPGIREAASLRALGSCLLIVSACLALCYLLLDGSARLRLGYGELRRLASIEDWYRLHATEPPLGIIAVGDSLGRSAFNARIINEQAGQDLAWNLASSARTYPEMLLDIGRPALRESTLVLFVSPVTSFSPSKLGLNRRKANIYGLLGLPDGLADNAGAYGSSLDTADMAYLRQRRWQHVLESRWRLPELAKTELLIHFGPRRERYSYLLSSYQTDLFYPAYGDTQEPAAIKSAVASRVSELQAGRESGIDNPRCRQALRDVVQGLQDSSRRLLIVMYPLDPAYQAWLAQAHPDYDKAWLQELLGVDVEILDLSGYTAAGLFRDDLHISDEASADLSLHIADYLQQADGAGR